MFLPGLDWELGDGDVEEFNGAVTTTDCYLIFVSFGPGGVEEGVLGIITIITLVPITTE